MFSYTTAQHIYCTVCNWTVLTVITQKLPLHVQLHNNTAHLLYKLYTLQLNCTYNNYTEAAATCSAAQRERNRPPDVFWSAVLPVAWYCMFIYRQSYPEIKSVKAINMTVNALPQPHSSTQHTPKLLSGDCEPTIVANSSVGMRLRNSWWWRNPAWWVGQAVRHWFIVSVWHYIPAASAFLSHSAICTATKHRCQGTFHNAAIMLGSNIVIGESQVLMCGVTWCHWLLNSSRF